MSTYRYGAWVNNYSGFRYYNIEKKTFFGWKEIVFWSKNIDNYNKMLNYIDQLRKSGNIVYER